MIDTTPYYQDWLTDTLGLLAINSVRDDSQASATAPYGPGPKQALQFMMQLAQRDGFTRTNIIGNRVGYIEIGPESDQAPIGVIVHVDTVPVNDLPQWHSDPFSPVVKDNFLYARGADDMKSEVTLSYYALKYLVDHNVPLNRPVRLIIGTDEESEWTDMHQYFAEEQAIEYGFSPDGDADLAYGEKGISQLDLYFDSTNASTGPQLIDFHSGQTTNMLPGTATATVSGLSVATLRTAVAQFTHDIPDLTGAVTVTTDGITITFTGKATHAARPETGLNAATYLAHFLSQYEFGGTAADFLNFVGHKVHDDPFGEKSGYGGYEPKLGHTTQNIGITDFAADKTGHLNLNFRYSLAFDEQAIIARLQAEHPWLTDVVRDSAGLVPHYVNPNSPIVQLLQAAYEKATGKPVTLTVNGGASFGRLMPQGVGFGARITDDPSTAHQANERFDLAAYEPSLALLIDEITQLANEL